MQFKNILVALFASSALAAGPISTFAATEWTIESLSRACDAADTSCTWKFGINTNVAGVNVTACNFTVKAIDNIPASHANGGPAKCGIFNITSGWSDQFGADQAFTVLSVVDYAKKLIAYPGYTDAAIKAGKVVSPDLSFPVQALP